MYYKLKMLLKYFSFLQIQLKSSYTKFIFGSFGTIKNIKEKTLTKIHMNCLKLLCFVQIVCSNNKPQIYKKYAVNSELPEASEIGVKILQRGGNSLDAAIATCLAVGIVNSFSSGLGGGGFILIKKRGLAEQAFMIDFREITPSAFDINKILENKDRSKIGGMSVGIPCELKGLYYAHMKHGKLPWTELFQECIDLCKGFRVSKELARRLKKFEKDILNDEGLRETYTINGKVVQEGDIVKRPNLQETLEYLKTNPNGFDKGRIVNRLVEFINSKGGNVSASDFAYAKPRSRKPLVDTYKDYKVYTTSLPSSGILVIEALKILENMDIQTVYEESLKSGQYTHIHLLIEVCKFIMAKRGELGDPKVLINPMNVVDKMRSSDNISRISSKLNKISVLHDNDYEPSKFNVVDHGTTHINVYDEGGLIVALTSTINLEFGAKIMDPVTGIILNNQIDDFYFPDKQEDLDNATFIPNLARPRQIPLSSAAPVILETPDKLLVLGAAGGVRIPTSIVGVLYWLTLGYSLDEAINKPRLHHQYHPNVVYVEKTEDPKVIAFLESLGHTVEVSATNSVFTSVQGIAVERKANENSITAVSDKRKGGQSLGV